MQVYAHVHVWVSVHVRAGVCMCVWVCECEVIYIWHVYKFMSCVHARTHMYASLYAWSLACASVVCVFASKDKHAQDHRIRRPHLCAHEFHPLIKACDTFMMTDEWMKTVLTSQHVAMTGFSPLFLNTLMLTGFTCFSEAGSNCELRSARCDNIETWSVRKRKSTEDHPSMKDEEGDWKTKEHRNNKRAERNRARGKKNSPWMYCPCDLKDVWKT